MKPEPEYMIPRRDLRRYWLQTTEDYSPFWQADTLEREDYAHAGAYVLLHLGKD